MSAPACRLFLRNLGLQSPGLLQGGATRLGRCFLFHWPTLLAASPYALTLFSLPPGASWQALRDAAASSLPGRPVALEALSPDDLPAGEDPAMLTACEAPFDGSLFGLAPDPRVQDFSRLPHNLRQLYYALDDLSSPDVPGETGLWRDPETGRLVINWLVRVVRYPFGHEKSALVQPSDSHWSVLASLQHVSTNYCARPSSRAFNASVLASPWAGTPGYLSVVHVEPLLDHFRVLSNPRVRKPRSVAPWPVFLQPSTISKNPHAPEWSNLEAWLDKRGLPGLPLKAVKLRTQWAISLPAGVFSGDERTTVDFAARDALLATFIAREREIERNSPTRVSKPRTVIFDAGANLFTYAGEVYYTERALEVFCQLKTDNFAVFEAVRIFLSLARQDDGYIATAKTRNRRRSALVADSERLRAKRWTQIEDDTLRRFFGFDSETGERTVMSPRYWELLFERLDESHRSVKQVQHRVSYLNNRLLAELKNGEPSLSSQAAEEYKRRRLGQRDRNV